MCQQDLGEGGLGSGAFLPPLHVLLPVRVHQSGQSPKGGSALCKCAQHKLPHHSIVCLGTATAIYQMYQKLWNLPMFASYGLFSQS